MTSAIAAAHNLAWKLAAVLAGWAGPALLDSYQTERRPPAQPAVTEATNAGLPVRIATLPAEATHTYGIGPTGAVLVRPDGYVAARWAASSDARPNALVGALTTIVAR